MNVLPAKAGGFFQIQLKPTKAICMDKLENGPICNRKSWPEIFGISESEVLEIMAAMRQYEGDQSYKDWCYMYQGIHKESPHENQLRGWLACYRWMKAKQTQTKVSAFQAGVSLSLPETDND